MGDHLTVLHDLEVFVEGLGLPGGVHFGAERGDLAGHILALLQVIAVEFFGGVDGQSKGVDEFDISFLLVDLAFFVPAVLQNLDDLAGILQNFCQAGSVFSFKVHGGEFFLYVGKTKGDVVVHRHVGPQGIVLEEKAHFALVSRDVDALLAVKDHLVTDGDAAAGGGLQAGDHTQGSGLAAAGGTQQGDEGVVFNDQVQVVYGVEFAPTLGHVF